MIAGGVLIFLEGVTGLCWGVAFGAVLLIGGLAITGIGIACLYTQPPNGGDELRREQL